MAQNLLAGAWRLLQVEGRSGEDEVYHPFGEHPSGMLIYAAGGSMAVTLMRTERTPFPSMDATHGTAAQMAAAYHEFEAYSGTWSLDPERKTVTHHVKQAKFPNWIGTDQLRHYSLEGNRLTLRTAPIMRDGSEWIITVVWDRLSAGNAAGDC